MKLKTKIPVSYNSGIAGTETGIVEGHLQDCAWLNDFNMIGANYTYKDEAGNQIFKNSFTVEGANIQALYEAIEDSIPQGLSFADTARFEFYLGFIFEMAKTFSVLPENIEIIA